MCVPLIINWNNWNNWNATAVDDLLPLFFYEALERLAQFLISEEDDDINSGVVLTVSIDEVFNTLTERFMLRSIIGRVDRGEEIEEVWIRERNGNLTLLYKKRTAG